MLTESDFTNKVHALGGQVYVVGGWVRDRLLGRSAHDKDYVICGIDKEVLEHKFNVVSVGHQFPVYQLNIEGAMREVALARTEHKTGRGYRGFAARFSPQTTIIEDLYRRDTRMNSMAMRLPDMALIDPFDGQADIRERVIRATSSHFCDDPVRALRAARQAAQLSFAVAPETIALMRKCRNEVQTEPSERIFMEMRKALEAPAPHVFFATLFSAGLLEAIFPGPGALSGMSKYSCSSRGVNEFEHAMSVLCRISSLSQRAETRLMAFIYAIDKALTLQDNCSKPHDCHLQGLFAFECLSRRMTLPRQWSKFIRFTLAHYPSIKRAKENEEIVEILLAIQKHKFSAREIAAFVCADGDEVPVWLEHADDILAFLDRERKHIQLPETLPPAKRNAWIVTTLAQAFGNYRTRKPNFAEIS